jgi:hypothetical protein
MTLEEESYSKEDSLRALIIEAGVPLFECYYKNNYKGFYRGIYFDSDSVKIVTISPKRTGDNPDYFINIPKTFDSKYNREVEYLFCFYNSNIDLVTKELKSFILLKEFI